MIHRFAMLPLLLATPGLAFAQQAEGPMPTDPVLPGQTQANSESILWVAGAAGGYIDRNAGPDSPYATASLTRYHGDWYMRGGVTLYESAIQQEDAALPSTYVIGSVGFGGTWRDWVLDLYGSAGNQRFGQIATGLGSRDSMAGTNAAYLALGARAGRRFGISDRTAVTGTVSLNYAKTRSLRHAIISGTPQDLQLPERSLTGSAAIRIDRGIGKSGRSQIGLSVEHFQSDNASTVLSFAQSAVSDQPGTPPSYVPVATETPDGWQEISLSGTFSIGKSVWLDTEVRRSFGSVSSNATTLSLGLRLKL